jgi:UDP-glucose:(heptosyl)LPS alpha-1,3-glucosyltransferase
VNVAFVIPGLEPSLGGVERYAFGLACGLARRGVRVTAFTGALPAPTRELPPGLVIERVSPEPGRRATRERRFDAAAAARLGELRRWDVVQGFGATRLQTHHRIGGGSHAAYLRARARHEGRAWSGLESALPPHRGRIARQREVLRTPGLRLLANSAFARRDACADAGLPMGGVPVIHSGVDLTAFRPEPDAERRLRLRRALGLSESATTALFVGSGFRRKGLGFAVEMLAAARTRGADLELLVVGRGRQAPYRRLARRLGVEAALRFAGRVQDVAATYAACDVFLLPSLYEPFSNAALEAMACGLPLLVTADSGTAEVVRDGREGRLLAGPDDVAGGAVFLTRIAGDAELRRTLGARARRTAEGLDLDTHVERVLQLYQTTCASGRGLSGLIRAGVDEAALVPAVANDQGAVAHRHPAALPVLGHLGQHTDAGPEASGPRVDEDGRAPDGQLTGNPQGRGGAEPGEAAHAPAIGSSPFGR